jgi:hypothetical protein
VVDRVTRQQSWDAKLGPSGRPPPRAARQYITRDEATGAAVIIGAALGLAVAAVMLVWVHANSIEAHKLTATTVTRE